MSNEYLALNSEIHELESILADLPSDDVIERKSFENRLSVVKAVLSNLAEFVPQKKAHLTFRGHPVFASHGIAADFGSKAAGAFADAFATVVASLNESLNYMGPVPDKEKNQLLITGIATGSFGFEFELPNQQADLFPGSDEAEKALEKLQSLLQLSAEGTDDEVAELIDEIHPRAIKKIAGFLGYLVQQNAWCGLEFKDKFFRFSDLGQLEIAAERLKEENIREADEEYVGEFEGVLPHSRTFEFRLADQPNIIKGKIDIAVEDADLINREWLHKSVRLKLRVIQVGQGRPRFTLPNLSVIQSV